MFYVMVEQQRRFLGLTHNPFVQPGDDFFEQGDRKTYLDQLRHLSQWSRRVLLATGPAGVGKTTLFRKLSTSLEPRVKAARINGTLVNTTREVLMAIAQGYGLATPSDANRQLLREAITSHVDEQESAERICITLIDDAEVLEPKAFDDLLELLTLCSIRLVFFGEVRFVSQIEKSADNLDVGWHEIRLTGFGAKDVRAYLEWRFHQARYRGHLPFTYQQINEITKLSEGLPGRIDQMANVLLVKLESGDLIAERSRFPAVHRALLVLLLLVITLAYLIWQQTPLPWLDEPDELAMMEPSVDKEPAADKEPSADEEPSADKEPSDATDNLSGQTIEAEALSAEPIELAPDTVRPLADSKTPATATDRSQPSSQASPFKDDYPDRASSEPPPSSEPEEPESITPISKEPQPELPPTSPATAYKDASWLMAQPGDAFTLQLLTLSSAERVQAYLASQERPERFATYRLSRNGRILHVVVYGSFATRSQAEAESRRLPASVGQVKPWLRTMTQVQSAIRTALQQ